MDLQAYYNKIRVIEQSIMEIFALVVSLHTADGGKPGVVTEVPKRLAAKMVVDGTARLASAEETHEYRGRQEEAARAAQEKAAAEKVHLSVVPTDELNRLTEAVRSNKS
jgi:hypothetical protein